MVFSVGPDGGLQNVGLNLTVSTGTPEPSGIALLGIGVIALVIVRASASRKCSDRAERLHPLA